MPTKIMALPKCTKCGHRCPRYRDCPSCGQDRAWVRDAQNQKQDWTCGPCRRASKSSYAIPTRPEAPPIARMVKRREGVLGHPWIEILFIAPGAPKDFFKDMHYFCRFPNPVGPELDDCLGWFTDVDLFGDGRDVGEYDPIP